MSFSGGISFLSLQILERDEIIKDHGSHTPKEQLQSFPPLSIKLFCQIKGLSFYIYLIEALIKYYQILLRIRRAMAHIRFASLSVLQYTAFGVCCQCPLVVVTLQISSLCHIRNMLYKSKMVYML